MAKKEISWRFIRETKGQKYFLVEKARDEFVVFRTPSGVEEGSKNYFTLGEWGGEIVIWGGIPIKVRNWILRYNLKLDLEKKDVLTSAA